MLIIGTGGLSSDILSSMEFDGINFEKIVLYNDTDIEPIQYIKDNFKILINLKEAKHYFKNECNEFIVGVGDNKKREHLTSILESIGGVNVNYISKEAYVSKYVKLGTKGVIILHTSVIGNSCNVGKGSIIYTGASIGHESLIGNYNLISGHACMSNVKIGNYTQIGIGVCLKPGVTIGDNSSIGVGSVVRKNVPSNSMVSGNPAKIYRRRI